jgi:oxygen-independent coproporphyrinogen-3 oxidase
MQATSIYIHWPFCKSKCPYCDFNSHVREKIDTEIWLEAYLKEIDYFTEYLSDKKIVSIFFGGGTPSLMPPHIAGAIIEKLAKNFMVASNVEITLEANPTSIEAEKFKAFAKEGINRVSVGIQSLNEQDLKFLGRTHSREDAIDAILIAKDNFDKYSFDLIYARPHQTLSSWEEELTGALKLAKDHLSLYQLTIEKGTPFYSAFSNKQFTLPDENLASDLFNLTQKIMADHAMPAYEISNHAKVGSECLHNLTYWRYQDYLGIGPGAHSRIDNKAVMMIHSPEKWLQIVKEKGVGIQTESALSKKERIEEMLLMGLRLTDGINIKTFENRFDDRLENLLLAKNIEYLLQDNLIEVNENIKATSKGRLLLNQIIARLVV